MKSRLPLVGLLILVLLIPGVGSKPVLGADGLKYLPYVSDEYGFSLEYPSDWTVVKDFLGTAFFLQSPLKNSTDKFPENINIVFHELSEPAQNVEEFSASSLAQMAQYIPDLNIIFDDTKKVAGMQSEVIVFAGKQGKLDLQWMQVYILADKKFYVITYTAEKEEYDDYFYAMEHLLKTFEFY